ncbi:MAG: VOC family protein [Actinomadura sp.]
MPELTGNAASGTPTWVDLGIPDPGRAMDFYGALFGWEFEVGPPETGGYTMCLLRGEPVAALMRNHDPDATSFWWNLYFATDDCDDTAARVGDAGGTIIAAPMDVMEQGRMAIATDPTGGQFGLWQGRAHTGSRIVNEPGSLFWNELVTPDSDTALTFYEKVFGYELESVPDPDFDYTALKVGGRSVAGLYPVPEAPAAWSVYFAVEDADAAAHRAAEAGGTAQAPFDSPYGRISVITDPAGAEFRVMTSTETSEEATADTTAGITTDTAAETAGF